MTADKLLMRGMAITGVAALAFWVWVPPALLLFLLVCSLTIYVMMRGMHHPSAKSRAEDVRTSRGTRERLEDPRDSSA